MQDPKEFLTEENIVITAKVLQALDITAETTFNKEHAKALAEKIKVSESTISELAEELSNQLPAKFLMLDGSGYRMLFTMVANVLIATDREDLAEVFLAARTEEL